MHRADAEMARAGPPCARAAAANIDAGGGYSGRGRRPVAATPSARLFSEHYLQHIHFLRANIGDVNVRISFRYSSRRSLETQYS